MYGEKNVKEIENCRGNENKKEFGRPFQHSCVSDFMQILYYHGSWFRLCPHFFTEGLNIAFVGLLGMLATLNNEQRVCRVTSRVMWKSSFSLLTQQLNCRGLEDFEPYSRCNFNLRHSLPTAGSVSIEGEILKWSWQSAEDASGQEEVRMFSGAGIVSVRKSGVEVDEAGVGVMVSTGGSVDLNSDSVDTVV